MRNEIARQIKDTISNGAIYKLNKFLFMTGLLLFSRLRREWKESYTLIKKAVEDGIQLGYIIRRQR
ncbi:MAG: hypothetical protein HPY87_00055 [Fervidobacterium sp.]|uniref:hypothetical protein n=1 Tax=Fervidobacterium sp. TaxID=1871331 RepID=UPI0025C427C1|nr:hypothetical protein [Fervidobacterium sp.]NPU88330.1 hypothetical protein [Fervidobacterium sp.]